MPGGFVSVADAWEITGGLRRERRLRDLSLSPAAEIKCLYEAHRILLLSFHAAVQQCRTKKFHRSHRRHWAEVLEVKALAPAAPQASRSEDALTKDENGQAEISSV
jgi:hypothetical protein